MLEQQLIQFVTERTDSHEAIGLHSPLFSEGLLDSMMVLELTVFVERISGVQFPPSDITLENIDSVGRILAFIQSKRSG